MKEDNTMYTFFGLTGKIHKISHTHTHTQKLLENLVRKIRLHFGIKNIKIVWFKTQAEIFGKKLITKKKH